MFDKIKKWFGTPEAEPAPAPEPKAKKAPKKKELTPKEQANAIGEPYVNIISVDLDPADINNGSFELDWNDKFLANLVKQGYKIRPDDTEAQIVDRWFQTVCRNIALEVYEQEIADPDKRESEMRIIQQRDLGGGFTEVS
jgi:hypothetical protein